MSASHATCRTTVVLGEISPSDLPALRPLDRVQVVALVAGALEVSDAAGRVYVQCAIAPSTPITFQIAGALGTHALTVRNEVNETVAGASLQTIAETTIEDDTGFYQRMLAMLNRTMRCYSADGTIHRKWRNRSYGCFIHWILDHHHVSKGMRYASPHVGGLLELLAATQLEDGMVWSFADDRKPHPGFFDSAHARYGYARRDEGLLLVRQPVENHCEHEFVQAIHLAWKSGAGEAWTRALLPAARKALEYTRNAPVRWSDQFGLLKRGYTIDSWDFQVNDAHTVHFPLATEQMIDPQRTKFGIFFGDNHGYANACECLAEMIDALGEDDAATYRERALGIRRRLDALTWNGEFYRHRVEEDATVKRDLGVDESRQIAQGNCYAMNRGIAHDRATAILRTYQSLRDALPKGSPGEWYSIYPPFERGFGRDNAKWQYMNGGIATHAAGELARGAFEHGFEEYAVDVLRRLMALSERHGNRLHFAYTGAQSEPPPPPTYVPIDLAPLANMDIRDSAGGATVPWMHDTGTAGNDIASMPTGELAYGGVPFRVANPVENDRRVAIGISQRAGWAPHVEIPVGARAGAIHLLHAAASLGPGKVAAAIRFIYENGDEHAEYLLGGKHVCGWWFPSLDAPHAAIAWRGPNGPSADVGVCRSMILNPRPDLLIHRIVLEASAENANYALLGLTLADRPPYAPSPAVSFGGPDNWAGGTVAAALIDGLAGIGNQPGTAALQHPRLSPRWSAAGIREVRVVAHYPISSAYIAYHYNYLDTHTLTLTVTGSGDTAHLRLLLPPTARITTLTLNGRPSPVTEETIETSRYLLLTIPLPGPTTATLHFTP